MIKINRCGYNSKHSNPFESNYLNGSNQYTLLYVKSDAFFYINGIYTETKTNMFFLFDENSRVHYGSSHSSYNDDWIAFSFIEEIPFMELSFPLNIPLYVVSSGILPSLFPLLSQVFHSTEQLHKDATLDQLMRSILLQLHESLHIIKTPDTNPRYYEKMVQLRTEIYNSPHKDWTVSAMADSLHLSTSYFQNLYKTQFGVSCMQDVITSRIEHAKYYLMNSDMSIHTLSEFCGYTCEAHFIRQFKKITGVTPTSYRNSH